VTAHDRLGRVLAQLEPSDAHRVADLANRLGVSERQLRRNVRASLGVSPSAWLRRRRLLAALQMLMTAQSVKQVAFVLGFKQMSQFSRDFKGQFGCAPSLILKAAAALPARATGQLEASAAGRLNAWP
jgi:AraC family transcriptional regulator of adaptative response / DNA-3-methyladenine glycosylase II